MPTIAFRPKVEDSRVVLRQWTAADFEFYAAYLGDEATAKYIGGAIDKPKAWRHLASLIGHWALRGFGVYAVERLGGGQIQGCAGLWEPHGWPCREFVFWFTTDAYASGCALHATQLAITQVNTTFPLEPVIGFIHPHNRAALALASTLGGTLHGEEPLMDFGPHIRVSFPTSHARSRQAETLAEENLC